MDIDKILSVVDHTLLAMDAKWQDIKAICDDGIKYKTASVCIPPSFVKRVKDYAGEKIKICTVIGFPNGYNTAEVKAFEAADAVRNGADEIDMVINLGFLKEKQYDSLQREIELVKSACGDKILKVIIETCLLSREEKIKMCEIVGKAGADYIKTSTGFSLSGATAEDIALMKGNVPQGLKIKAAGDISSLEDAQAFIALGADRIGTSRVVKIIKNQDNGGY